MRNITELFWGVVVVVVALFIYDAFLKRLLGVKS